MPRNGEMKVNMALPAASKTGGLTPDLYQRRGTVVRRQSAVPQLQKIGEIQFYLSFDFKTSDLAVQLCQAQGISSTDTNRRYCLVVDLKPPVDNRLRKSAIYPHCNKISFHGEIFKFPMTFEEIFDREIVMTLFKCETFGETKDVLAECTLDLSTVDVSTQLEMWLDLETKEEWSAAPKVEILVSLSYLPAAERLTICSLQCQNLPFGISDLYLRLSLFCGEKLLKRKKTNVIQPCGDSSFNGSSSSKGTLTFHWEESFTFKCHNRHLEECRLNIELAGCLPRPPGCGWTSHKSVILGHLQLAQDAPSARAREQWMTMLQRTNESSVVSHSLTLSPQTDLLASPINLLKERRTR